MKINFGKTIATYILSLNMLLQNIKMLFWQPAAREKVKTKDKLVRVKMSITIINKYTLS